MSIFHTHIVMPLAEPELHAGLGSRLRAIRRFERMPEKRQREQRHARLRSLLEYAYATVPYYRKQFDDAGFDPSNLRPGEAIPIPSLSHDVLRERLRESASSASLTPAAATSIRRVAAGFPSSLQSERESARNKAALGLQLDHWAGYEAGDSVLILRETPSNPSAESGWKSKFYEEVLMRRSAAPCATLSGEILGQLRLRYERQRPKVLCGSSAALAAFASHLRQHGMHHRVQVVLATADALSDRQRNLIESAFGLRMYVRYARQGIGTIAAECPDHEGLHFHPWGSFVEFEPIASTSEGTMCRLVVTDLLNYSAP